MTCRPDKVQTSMDTEVNFVLAAWLLLLKHVGFVLIIKKFNDRHPRIPIVDIVAKSGSIDDR